MKRGLARAIADDYAKLFGVPWVRVRNEFMRREGAWVQIFTFNPSRGADEYVPRTP